MWFQTYGPNGSLNIIKTRIFKRAWTMFSNFTKYTQQQWVELQKAMCSVKEAPNIRFQ